MNRIDRLTAILIHLQTKKVVRAEEIAERFEMSLRTVYRDVKALMEAGVPIGSEAGKGYFIVDGYHLPPVMFTQDEANSMLLAAKVVEKVADKSVSEAFSSALHKIKSVLPDAGKDHLENLDAHIEFGRTSQGEPLVASKYLADIQRAIAGRDSLRIDYQNSNEQASSRIVEPIGLFYYGMAWHLIAWCRMRNSYRDFRTDRIQALHNEGDKFDPRNLLSLQEYLTTIVQANREVHRVVVSFDESIAKFARQSRYYHGFASEEVADGRVRMNFLSSCLHSLCRWLLTYGNMVEVESPDEAKDLIVDLIEELSAHYTQPVAR
ncbi:YafY family protein [Chryseolinea sp. T2]|uniref:helix-turn-helix transcriptional regulator n=1 Tax=Chryseolinea sp. T2 TaxID=3129255 RepID=UPI00307877B1